MSMCNHHFLKDISFNIWRKWKSPLIWAILIHCAQKPLIWYKLLTFYENNLEVTFFFLEVLILPSIIIFKHFPSKKNVRSCRFADFIYVQRQVLTSFPSRKILNLNAKLQIFIHYQLNYFCSKFFFHCPIRKTFEINVK